MTETLVRSHAVDLEVRGDGRTIVGIAVPFNQPTPIRDMHGSYDEVFRRGAFARTIAEGGARRVKVLANHRSSELPLGRAELLREDTNGLYAELRISATDAGDEVLTLVRDGALDALSISFSPVRSNKTRAGLVERLEARLREISVVGFPAYVGAAITGVRAEASTPLLTPEAAILRLAQL
jgi:HK97 family phage prohead protease